MWASMIPFPHLAGATIVVMDQHPRPSCGQCWRPAHHIRLPPAPARDMLRCNRHCDALPAAAAGGVWQCSRICSLQSVRSQLHGQCSTPLGKSSWHQQRWSEVCLGAAPAGGGHAPQVAERRGSPRPREPRRMLRPRCAEAVQQPPASSTAFRSCGWWGGWHRAHCGGRPLPCKPGVPCVPAVAKPSIAILGLSMPFGTVHAFWDCPCIGWPSIHQATESTSPCCMSVMAQGFFEQSVCTSVCMYARTADCD